MKYSMLTYTNANTKPCSMQKLCNKKGLKKINNIKKGQKKALGTIN